MLNCIILFVFEILHLVAMYCIVHPLETANEISKLFCFFFSGHLFRLREDV